MPYDNLMKERARTTTWLNDWVRRTFDVRIHVSHNDMDGLGCFVVEDVYRTLVLKKTAHGIIHAVTVSRPDEVNDTLVNKITALENEGKLKPDQSIMILVTDLCPDPTVFKNLLGKGYDLTFCVIDHHQNHRGYDKIVAEDLVLNPRGSYLIDTKECATKLISRSMYAMFHCQLNATATEKENALLTFVQAVDRFDTGNWGEWANLDAKDVDVSVKEQLIFASYRRDEKENYWVVERAGFILDCCGLNDITRWTDVVETELKALMDEYRKFKDDMVNMSEHNVPLFTATIGGKQYAFADRTIDVHGVVVENRPSIKNFSLISRQILEEYPFIDILVVIDCNRNAVELRSGRNGPDVSKIAHFNGGGGHPRAAGFPLKIGGDM